MPENWHNWCRLCAKRDSRDKNRVYKLESIADQLEIVNKYFKTSFYPLNGAELPICDECSEFLVKLDGFKDHSLKVDRMFNELTLNRNISDEDLQSIRFKFGVDVEESPVKIYLTPQANEEDNEDIVPEEFKTTSVESDDEEKPISQRLRRSRRSKPSRNAEVSQQEPKTKLKSQNDKKKNRKKQETEKNQCGICSKTFSRLIGLKNHMLTMHLKDEMPFQCSKCPKRFVSKSNLKVHETSHLPDSKRRHFTCSLCDKKLTQKGSLKIHINSIHMKEKLFVCEECGRSFNTKAALCQHRLVHTNEHPFQCSFCPKKFKFLPAKRRHEEIHTDTKYECPECGLKLNTKRTLWSHMLVHSDKKKYKCNYCGNEYKRAKTLKDHLFLHTGQRPYECPFCDKTFTNNPNCRSHKKKEHPLELAALEASGKEHKPINLPKLEDLQSKLANAIPAASSHP